MIAYFFPPLGGGGVQRSSKFVKYLPHQGWTPVVLTVQPNRRNRIEQGVDRSLLADIPKQIEVITSRSVEFAALYEVACRLRLRKALFELESFVPFLHQDYKIGWYPFALRAARRRLKSSPFDVIYTSSPPHVAHFIGRALSREYGIPWVADFRDLWTQRTTYRPKALFQAKVDRHLEASVLASADAVIANTPTNKHLICRGFDLPAERVHVIPNGYDPEDFEGLDETAAGDRSFVISCIGKFYEMPDVQAFFLAYRRFQGDHPNVHLRFLGPRSRRVRRACERLLRPGSWEATERIEHTEAILLMRRTAVLLANLPSTADDYWVPGKLYEYLAARRPILLIGPLAGDAASIVNGPRGADDCE